MLLQFKAIFLILIFGANTLIGFCCGIGMNMSFSPFSRLQINSITNTPHKEHKKHIVLSNKKNSVKDGNCCNGRVIKLAQTDKSLSDNQGLTNKVFLTSFISSFLNFHGSLFPQINSTDSYFLKNYHPPITDIRIAIRSFQI